jgi:hypothetical protein
MFAVVMLVILIGGVLVYKKSAELFLSLILIAEQEIGNSSYQGVGVTGGSRGAR